MQAANRRIAKNTVYMYVRLVTAMVVGLYTSRLVLEILGVSDYGLFAVVGGVLAVFTFISTSLATATSRFFNIEMGREGGDVNASFNINLVLHAALAVVIFVLAETVGLWYVYNRLNVAPGKLDDAVFVYHVSILTACLGIVNNPYQSLFTAHERFKFLAVLEIVNVLIRLGCVLLLCLYRGPYALRVYSVIFALTTANAFVVYHVVAHRRWKAIVRRRFVRGWRRYRSVLTFGGWNVLATVSYTARSSGSDLLLNSFFGTAMNGAFAIAKTVNNSLMPFVSNFDSASAPQIIQAYAAGDRQRYTYLCNKLGRINLLVFVLMAFPLLCQLDWLLHLWLGTVPDHALEFCVLFIVSSGVSVSCGGIYNLMNACDNIKWFKINCSFFFLICIPVGYVLFTMGYQPYTILVLFIAADVMQRIVQLMLLRRIMGFDSWHYVKEAYTRPAVICAIMTGLLLAGRMLPAESGAVKLATVVGCFIATALLVAFVGLDRSERRNVLTYIRKRI